MTRLLPVVFGALAGIVLLAPAAAAQTAVGAGPRPIRSGETLQGTLTGSDPTLPDGSYFDLYRYQGAPGETVVFTMRSQDFDAFLSGGTLQGSTLTADAQDDDSAGGTDAEMTVEIGPSGVFTVRANSLEAGRTGRYTLSAESIGGGAPAGGGRVVQAGETLRGTLSPSDPTLPDGSHYDLYTYTGTSGDVVTVTLRSDAFDAYLTTGTLRGERFEAEANDDDSAGGTDAELTVTVGYAGTFSIRANSLGAGQTGDYVLAVTRTGGGALAGATPIRAGTPVRGTLAASDPTLPDGSHYDLFAFEGRPNEAIEVFLASTDFDAYLGGGLTPDAAVRGDDSDDDDGGGTNARLRVQAGPDGRYTIRANSLYGDVAGAYTLTVRSVGGGGEAPAGLAMLQLGRAVEGQLDSGDPTLTADGTYFDVYGYAGTPGEEVVITLASSQFDPYVLLNRYFGDEVEAVAQDDDSGPGLAARIRTTLSQSGTYLVVANSAGPGATGRYTLTVERPEAVTEAEVAGRSYPTLGVGAPVSGQLAPSDLVLADDSYADRYTFQGVPGDEVDVTLRSTAFDAYLTVGTLEGGDFTPVASDDDGAGGTDARVRFTVGGSGTYAVQANAFEAGTTGPYTLLAERVADPASPRPGPDATPVPQARFSGKWAPLTYAGTAHYEPIRESVSRDRRLESVAEGLNAAYPLPQNVPISFEECTEPGADQPYVNAFYSPDEGHIRFCYELMDDLIGTFRQGLPPEQVDEAVGGAYDFILLHEVGHALTHQLDLPITGREEDVADQFATLALLRQGDKGAMAALSGVNYLYGGQTQFDKRYFADEHSLGPQRLFNVQCWILGSDVDKYAWLVLDEQGQVRDDEFTMTIERARRCTGEYTQMEKSFTRLLNLAYGR